MLVETARKAKKSLEELGCTVFLEEGDAGVESVIVEGERCTDTCIDLLNDLGPTRSVGFVRAPVTCKKIGRYNYLRQLTSLSFVGPNYTNEYCDLLERVERLEFSDLNESAITDVGIAAIGKLPFIEYLSLDGCRITGKSLASLGPTDGLWYLGLQDTTIGDDIIEYLKGAKALRTLLLKGTGVTDALLKTLPSVTLETLGLQGTKVTDEGVASLARLPKLDSVYLDETKVTKALLPRLRAFPKLQEVHVSGTSITEEEMDAVIKELDAKRSD